VDTATGAEIAGCSPSTFKVRLHRARRRLAELLADQPTTLPEPVGDPS
jgi:DNA-directed RNA polymerase specialized sigma24 family protein